MGAADGGFDQPEGTRVLLHRLAELREEHRALDAAIMALHESGAGDALQLARLKTDLAGGLRYFLLTCPLDNEFDPLGHAPHTADRELVIKAGAGEIYSAIIHLIESADEPLVAKDVVSTGVLYNAIRSDCRGLTNKQMCRALQDMGYRKVGQRLLKDNERHMLWFHPETIAPSTTPIEAANIRLAMQDLI